MRRRIVALVSLAVAACGAPAAPSPAPARAPTSRAFGLVSPGPDLAIQEREREVAAADEAMRTGAAGDVVSSERFVAELVHGGARVYRAPRGAEPELVLRVRTSNASDWWFMTDGRLVVVLTKATVVIDIETLHVDRLEGAVALVEAGDAAIATAGGRVRLLRRFDFFELASVELKSPTGGAIRPIADAKGVLFGAIVGGELVSFEKKQSLGSYRSIGDVTSDGERALACLNDESAGALRYATVSTRTGVVERKLPIECEYDDVTLDPSGRYAVWAGRSEKGEQIVIESLDVAKGTRRSLRTRFPYPLSTNLGLAPNGTMLCIWNQTISAVESTCGFRVGASGAIEYFPAPGTMRSDWGNVVTAFDGGYELVDGALVSRRTGQSLRASPEEWGKTPLVDLSAHD